MLKLLLTCEHGGNKIPPAYAALFKGQETLLATHRGYDIGVLDIFHTLKDLAASSFYAEESRLLVELNRSEDQHDLFSEITGKLAADEKQEILQKHYYPFRNAVEQQVQEYVAEGHQVLHLSIHSFTPVLNGEMRQTDIGLLFDPEREPEVLFCKDWKEAFKQESPEMRVCYNYPYLGTADGFTTYLRRKHSTWQYRGIELEVNQHYAVGEAEQWQRLKSIIKSTLTKAYRQHKQSQQCMNLCVSKKT